MRLNQYSNFNSLYSIVQESNYTTIGLFPGAFKPPHRGHYATANIACGVCDVLYIIMSPKHRVVGEPSKDLKGPESNKYSGLLPGGKHHDKYSGKLNIELAEVDRLTSASAMRQAIKSTADVISNTMDISLDTQDFITYKNNIEQFLPQELSPDDTESVVKLLSNAPRDLVITADEAADIWRIYINNLKRSHPNVEIKFVVAKTSPIIDTYDIVDNIYNNVDSMTNINLYTG